MDGKTNLVFGEENLNYFFISCVKSLEGIQAAHIKNNKLTMKRMEKIDSY